MIPALAASSSERRGQSHQRRRRPSRPKHEYHVRLGRTHSPMTGSPLEIKGGVTAPRLPGRQPPLRHQGGQHFQGRYRAHPLRGPRRSRRRLHHQPGKGRPRSRLHHPSALPRLPRHYRKQRQRKRLYRPRRPRSFPPHLSRRRSRIWPAGSRNPRLLHRTHRRPAPH